MEWGALVSVTWNIQHNAVRSLGVHTLKSLIAFLYSFTSQIATIPPVEYNKTAKNKFRYPTSFRGQRSERTGEGGRRQTDGEKEGLVWSIFIEAKKRTPRKWQTFRNLRKEHQDNGKRSTFTSTEINWHHRLKLKPRGHLQQTPAQHLDYLLQQHIATFCSLSLFSINSKDSQHAHTNAKTGTQTDRQTDTCTHTHKHTHDSTKLSKKYTHRN